MSADADDPKVTQAPSPRQWISLVGVYLSIPLVLMVCGGDFGWWQAWGYSLLIVVVGLGGRIWAEQRHPGLLAERQNLEKAQSAKAWDKVLAPLMALSLSFPLVIVAGLDHRFGWSPAHAGGQVLQSCTLFPEMEGYQGIPVINRLGAQ